MIAKEVVLKAIAGAFIKPIHVWTVEDGRQFSVFARGDGSFLFDSRVNSDGVFPSYTMDEVISQFTIPVTAISMSRNDPPTRWLVTPLK